MSTSPGHPALARRLGTLDATVIGVGSMVGAGVFVAFAPAAELAGPWLPLALLLAAVVAWCNATSTAQLAAVHPASGGTYVYANRQLGPWPGFVAGWGFVTGKTASAAAMALTFGLYAAELTGADDAGARLLAVAAVLGLTAVNLGGVTRTARLTKLLVAPVLVVLLAVVVLLFSGTGPTAGGAPAGDGPGWDGTGWGVLPAAGTLFFAFAGYARVATMGEEVRDPARTIPRAVLGALAFTLLLYGLLGLGLLRFLGVDRLAASAAPLLTVVREAGWAAGPATAGAVVVTAAAALATLGALLALVAGISRTALAMARERDLPGPLGAVSQRHRVPWAAELAVAGLVVVLVLVGDVRTVIGFSSFGVLVYYALANLSALTLRQRPGWAPRAVNALGLAGCLVLAFTLPWQSVVTMLGVFAVGLAGRALALSRRP
ncbi:APC family permease [Kocuria rosea]|uniref:APC family permease n=1 Tax=Kocuria rosea TaxID=1275 RepID=UPI000F6F85EA|nr:APC family permease [Kocuria rosea]VEH43182.1 Serine/threonine exchanger SteT [Kocuria rosea]VEI49717.1 Serine/threonine exchanger SteT [Kocuria rosea]